MHRGRAIERAHRLAKQHGERLHVIPTGTGEYVVKTERAARIGGYLDRSIYVTTPANR